MARFWRGRESKRAAGSLRQRIAPIGGDMNLCCLIYVSDATRPIPDTELVKMVEKASLTNESRDQLRKAA